MDANAAVASLSALAHPGRLEVFRLLVRAGAEGMASGDIARATGHVPQTLSGNLNILGHAGLVSSRRRVGRPGGVGGPCVQASRG